MASRVPQFGCSQLRTGAAPIVSQLRGKVACQLRLNAVLADERLDATAWMALLAASVSEERGGVNLAQVAEAAGLPETTALRWMRYLEDRELVVRSTDSSGTPCFAPQQKGARLIARVLDTIF